MPFDSNLSQIFLMNSTICCLVFHTQREKNNINNKEKPVGKYLEK